MGFDALGIMKRFNRVSGQNRKAQAKAHGFQNQPNLIGEACFREQVTVLELREIGGKRRMEKPCYYYPGEKPYRMEDPFGNIVEIYSHSYELIYSEGAH